MVQITNYTQQTATILEQINSLKYTIQNLESHINNNESDWGEEIGAGQNPHFRRRGGIAPSKEEEEVVA